MRRSRFAKAANSSEIRDVATLGDALWFDVTRPETSGEESLSEWRLAGLQHAPLLLGVTHLLFIATCAALAATQQYCLCRDNPLIPGTLVVALDALAAALLFTRA